MEKNKVIKILNYSFGREDKFPPTIEVFITQDEKMIDAFDIIPDTVVLEDDYRTINDLIIAELEKRNIQDCHWCPIGGDISNNCEGCCYNGDYHYDIKYGDCILPQQ